MWRRLWRWRVAFKKRVRPKTSSPASSLAHSSGMDSSQGVHGRAAEHALLGAPTRATTMTLRRAWLPESIESSVEVKVSSASRARSPWGLRKLVDGWLGSLFE